MINFNFFAAFVLVYVAANTRFQLILVFAENYLAKTCIPTLLKLGINIKRLTICGPKREAAQFGGFCEHYTLKMIVP